MFINNTLKKDLLFKTTYFYKIINTENNQESETGQFRIIPAPINVLAPPQETQVANATTLQWTTPLKGPYIVILSQDESFKVSEKYITTDLFYEYEPTNSGKWYWMIKY